MPATHLTNTLAELAKAESALSNARQELALARQKVEADDADCDQLTRDLIAARAKIAQLEQGQTPAEPVPTLTVRAEQDGLAVTWSNADRIVIVPTGGRGKPEYAPLVVPTGTAHGETTVLYSAIKWGGFGPGWHLTAWAQRGAQTGAEVTVQVPQAPTPVPVPVPLPVGDPTAPLATDPTYWLPLDIPGDAILCRTPDEFMHACATRPDVWKVFEGFKLDKLNIRLKGARKFIVRDFTARGYVGKSRFDAVFWMDGECSEFAIYDGTIEGPWETLFAMDPTRCTVARLKVADCNEFYHTWHNNITTPAREFVVADNIVTGLLRHGIEMQGPLTDREAGGKVRWADRFKATNIEPLLLRNRIDGGDMANSLACQGVKGGRAIGGSASKGRPMYEVFGEWYFERNRATDRAGDTSMFWPNLGWLQKMTIGPGNEAIRTRPYQSYNNGGAGGPAVRVQTHPVLVDGVPTWIEGFARP